MTNTTTDAAEARALPVIQAARDALTHAAKELQELWGSDEGDDVIILDALAKIDAFATAEAASGAGEREAFLAQLRRMNTDRYHAWVGEGQDAGILFDAAELGGEVGELLNVVKKLEREERGWRGSRAAPEDFADECADVLICLDKLARRRGVDLEAATVAKFNATSEKVGLPHKLDAASLPPATDPAMVTVPREPTEAMMRAVEAVNFETDDEHAMGCNVWQAMLAAAPTIPATGEGA